MSLLDKLSKLGDLVLKPIETVTNWTNEPLKKWEHERNESSKEAEHRRTFEFENMKMKTEAELRMKEESAKVELEIRQKAFELDLAVKKETEIKKIISELDDLKKDQEIQRMERVSEAIMRYQKQLTDLNVNATRAIGNMQLELRERAQELVYDKTKKYKELQDLAWQEAAADLKKIESDFSNNEMAKNILTKAVDKKLSNIIDTALNFLIELNNDIKLLNQSINLLAENGQSFIENHLSHFHVAELPVNEMKMINDESKLRK